MFTVQSLESTPTMRRGFWLLGVVGIAIIGAVDFLSGFELRVFPLYYFPISLLAWHYGRTGAAVAALLSAGVWVGSNWLAGLQYSQPIIWVGNTLMQAFSFALVGALIASVGASLRRERGLSRTDALTQLLNGRAFFEESERMLALCRRKGRPATLAYVDLDNFKAVNDTRGHQAGDDLLERVATLIRTSLRPSDIVARLGGDEFAILMPETGADGATLALERLRGLLAELGAREACVVTASIGAATYASVPDDLEEMVHAADVCMYAAKGEGKNRLHLEPMTGAPSREKVPRSATPARLRAMRGA